MVTVGFADERGHPLGVDDWECSGTIPATGALVRPRVDGYEDRWVVVSQTWEDADCVILTVRCIDGFNER